MDLGMSITLNEDYMPYMIAVSLEMSDEPENRRLRAVTDNTR